MLINSPLYLNEYEYFMSTFVVLAEDGIRDLYVTGVQTCALPISGGRARGRRDHGAEADAHQEERRELTHGDGVLRRRRGAQLRDQRHAVDRRSARAADHLHRSEERRVGKWWTSRSWRERAVGWRW